MGSKKLALLYILSIYEKYSDCDHPLKYDDIISYLGRDYGIELERKAVGRNVSLLRESGFEIIDTPKGGYIANRKFEDSELRLLIDGVLSSRHITAAHSKELIRKLLDLSNRYFRLHIKNIYSVDDWSKTENKALFYNIEIVDEAIEKNKAIKFCYNKYGADKKLHSSSYHKVSPYQLILKNQHYYLMGYEEQWKDITFYRMDKISDIEITENNATDIRTIEGYQSGIDYKKISSAFPYMYSDNPERVKFYASKGVADQIIDWFGYDVTLKEISDDKIEAELCVSLKAMEYWAMQYLNVVEITYPQKLRDKIQKNLSEGVKKYCNVPKGPH